MDYLDYLNEDQHAIQRPAIQVLVDRTNLLNYFDEITFRDHFCTYKENALEIISLLESRLSTPSQRERPTPTSLQVLITLKFLTSGIFHLETGDMCSASDATVCRIVHKSAEPFVYFGVFTSSFLMLQAKPTIKCVPMNMSNFQE